jgi:hypothetical protein
MHALVEDKNKKNKTKVLEGNVVSEILFPASRERPRSSGATIPTILDIEASGFGRGSYPIEIGFVLADQRSQCVLIKPHPEWSMWDTGAERLHGIQRAQLQQRGIEIKEAAHILNEALRGQTVYSDAWGNDQTWLALLFEYADFLPAFKLQTLRALLNDTQLALWQPTKQAVIKELALGRHRASNDARILQLTYLRTLAASGDSPSWRKRA